MSFFKRSFLACFLLSSFAVAEEQSYVFEAKGEFAKELKNLVEKYSKDSNVSINIYENTPQQSSNGRFLNIGVDDKASYSVNRGQELYFDKCAKCHGEKGDKRAYMASKKLTQMSAEDIEISFSEYLNDPEYGGKFKSLMKEVASTTTYNDLGAIIVFLKGKDAIKFKGGKNENSDISTTPTQGSYLK
ncbi:MAG: c-type cytochrome [Campylobacter sp.]